MKKNFQDEMTLTISIPSTIAIAIAIAIFKHKYIIAAKKKKIWHVIKYTFYTALTAHVIAATILFICSLFLAYNGAEGFLLTSCVYFFFIFLFSLGLMFVWGTVPYSLISFIIYKLINRRKKERENGLSIK